MINRKNDAPELKTKKVNISETEEEDLSGEEDEPDKSIVETTGEKVAPFLEHLEELRSRLIWMVLAVIACAGISFPFMDEIIDFLAAPMISGNYAIEFQYLQPASPLIIRLKLAVICGIVIASPIILYHITRFVLPALYKRERKWYYFALLSFLSLFSAGVIFCYYVLAPMIFKFLVDYSMGENTEIDIALRPNLPDYIEFFTQLIIAAGLLFQLPIILSFLAKIGVVDDAKLKKGRPYAIIIILIVSAFITPPDVISQIVLGLPIMLLYEISISIAKFIRKRREARIKREEEEYNKEMHVEEHEILDQIKPETEE